MKLDANFTFSNVLFSQDNNDHLVVSLEAPAVDITLKRPPICIIAVIDVSSSMSGDNIDYVKKSAIKMVEHMAPGDYFGIATFGYEAYPVAKPVEITHESKEQLKKQIGDIYASGSTNLSGGMLLALEWGRDLDLPAETQIRAIIFTDGQANSGIATKSEDILKLAQKSRGRVTVSGFGFGRDCDQTMLSSLAASCEGNYAFIANPDDALTAFGKEMGGLLSVYASDIVITVKPTGANVITDIVSDVDADNDNGTVVAKLGDILSQEKRTLVLELKLKAQAQALPRLVNVADITISYSVLEDGVKVTKKESLKAKVKFVKDGEQDKAANTDLDMVVGIAQLVQAQIEAEAAANSGDYVKAHNLLSSFTADVKGRGLATLGTASAKLSTNYEGAIAYATSGGIRGSSRQMFTRSSNLSSSPLSADEDYFMPLRHVSGESWASNSVQDAYIASFSAPEEPTSVFDGGIASGSGTVVTSAPLPTTPTKSEKSKSKKRGRW